MAKSEETTRAIIDDDPTGHFTVVLRPKGSDKTIILDAGEDMSEGTLRVFQKHALSTIHAGNAKYQISSDAEGTTVELVVGNGIPIGISDEAPGGDPQKIYLKNTPGNADARAYFVNISNPGIYNNPKTENNRTGFDINVVKGKTIDESGQINYIDDLQNLQLDAVNGSTQSELNLKIGTGLKNNNTYYPTTNNEGRLYINPDAVIPELNSNVGKAKIQKTLGTYQRTVPGSETQGENLLIQQDFLNMGLQLPLRASGEFYIPKFGPNQTNDSPAAQIALARTAALAPGLARLGLRVPVTDINPNAVFDNQTNGVLKQKLNNTTNFPDLAVEAINSYGSYNNWIAPFDGIERLLQMPALAIMVGVVGTTVLAIAAAIQGITGKDTYEDQVRAGFMLFFGLSSPLGADRYDPAAFFAALGTAIISSRLLNETGWYSTVVRGFIKNVFQEISRGTFAVAATANIANSNQNTGILNRTGVDIYSDGIDGDIVGAAAKTVEIFLNSKLIGFCNMLAEIGADAVIRNQQGNASYVSPNKKGVAATPYATHGLTANQRSYIDSIIDGTETDRASGAPSPNESGIGTTSALSNAPNLSKLIMKDRLKNNLKHGTTMGARPTSFGTGTTPSMYLLPDSIKKAAVIAGGNPGLASLSTYAELGAMSQISPDDVKRFENALEASYMPFYIQDMRTNEILSFHAFIENMTDSFGAEYESETGFGRVEPTHIYQSTQRRMGIIFFIVSTNPDDHDEMWLKINKLVTLVYPQYTKGRALSNTTTGQNFIQPYSQVVGASPLVRLRVGDVWKSNYSKFNVMRLFGIGNAEFNLDASEGENSQFAKINSGGSFGTNQLYKNKLGNMLNFYLDSNDQILIEYNKQIDNRVFGAVPLGGTPLSRELAIPDLEPGLYKFKVKQGEGLAFAIFPTAMKPIVQYVLELVDTTGGPASGATYVLRYANVQMLGRNEIDLLGQYREAFQARFSAFENAPTEDLWQRSVAYSSLSVNVSVDYNWLKSYSGLQIPPPPGTPEPQAGAYTYQAAPGLIQDTITQKIASFFNVDGAAGNPIMQSFESNKGRGIAGFISQIDLDWADAVWETNWNPSRNSSRAPTMCKVDMKFLPIHDIGPGLDSDGFITSPVYPVGRYSNAINNAASTDKTETDEKNSAINLERDFGTKFTG